MPPPAHIQNSFATGVITPLMAARQDYQRTKNACLTLDGFVILPYGGATKTPGFQFVQAAKYADREVAFLEFVFSPTQAYQIEAGDEYFRFFVNKSYIPGSEIVTPYDHEHIAYLRGEMAINTMILTCRVPGGASYPPYKLIRTSATTFELSKIDFYLPPFMDKNTDYKRLAISHVTGSGRALTLDARPYYGATDPYQIGWYASNGGNDYRCIKPCTGVAPPNATYWELDTPELFEAGHVGAHFSFYNGYCIVTSVTDAQNAVADVLEEFDSTVGVWSWRESAWSDLRGWPAYARFDLSDRLVFSANDYDEQGSWGSRIGSYYQHKVVDPDNIVDSDAWRHRVGKHANSLAWMESTSRGLIFGSSGAEYRMGTEEAITPEFGPISKDTAYGSEFIEPVEVGGVFLFVARGGKIIRAFQYDYVKDRYKGEAINILAAHLTDVETVTCLALQQNPYHLVWSRLTDGTAAILTYMEEHELIAYSTRKTDGNFLTFGTIPGPNDDEVWACVERTVNGSTVRNIEVLNNFFTGDDIKDGRFLDSSVTVIGDEFAVTGATQANPVVITAVGHTYSNGNTVRFETVPGMTELNYNYYTVAGVSGNTFQLSGIDGTAYGEYDAAEWSVQNYTKDDYCQRDELYWKCLETHVNVASKSYPPPHPRYWEAAGTGGIVRQAFTNFSGLDHLEAKQVGVMTDGSFIMFVHTVSGGEIDLDNPSSITHIGLPHIANLETIDPDFPVDFGTIQGLQIETENPVIRVDKTWGLWLGPNAETLQELNFWDYTTYVSGQEPPLVSKKMGQEIVMKLNESDKKDGRMYLRHIIPAPCTILSITKDLVY